MKGAHNSTVGITSGMAYPNRSPLAVVKRWKVTGHRIRISDRFILNHHFSSGLSILNSGWVSENDVLPTPPSILLSLQTESSLATCASCHSGMVHWEKCSFISQHHTNLWRWSHGNSNIFLFSPLQLGIYTIWRSNFLDEHDLFNWAFFVDQTSN